MHRVPSDYGRACPLGFESHRLETMRPHRSIKTARCVDRKSCNPGQTTRYECCSFVRCPTQETDSLRAIGARRYTAYHTTSWPPQEAQNFNLATELNVTVTGPL